MGQISGFNTDPELNIHNDPITPDEEALLSTIQREFTNHEYVITENHECEDAHEKTIRRIADLLTFIHDYRQRTRIAIRDTKYAAPSWKDSAIETPNNDRVVFVRLKEAPEIVAIGQYEQAYPHTAQPGEWTVNYLTGNENIKGGGVWWMDAPSFE